MNLMKNRVSVHKIFVYLAFIFGMILIAIIPPFQSPDEDSHLEKALALADGQIFPKVENGQPGFMLDPEDVSYIYEKKESMIGNISKKVTYKEIFGAESLPKTKSEKEFFQFSTVRFNPVAHLIPTFGVLIGKMIAIFSLNDEPSVVFLLYFARLFNLLFYIAIVAYSIYITPYMKKTMCMLGLMPMALYLASSISYDAILISLSFLLVAKILYLVDLSVEFSKISIKDCIIFSIIAYIFLIIKLVYLPLFALFLFLPFDLKNEKKEMVKKIGLMLGIIIGLYLLYKIPESIFVRGIINSETCVGEQLNYVVRHPIKYLEILLVTILRRRDYYVKSFIGCFGLVDTNFFNMFVYFYLFFIIFMGIMDVSLSELKIKYLSRVVLGLSIAAAVFGIYLALYLTWTSYLKGAGVGASEIEGVQGRYFIPLALSTYLIFANDSLCKNKKIEKLFILITDNSVMVSLTMLCLTVIFVLLRFWC